MGNTDPAFLADEPAKGDGVVLAGVLALVVHCARVMEAKKEATEESIGTAVNARLRMLEANTRAIK
jgi:hypothetical protein